MTKSEVLLGRLIEERLTPGANLEEIDRRIRSLFEEEWCVVYTDMAGFSRHSPEEGIINYLTLVHEMKRMTRPILEASNGLIVKVVADTFLALFRRPPDALNALIQVNRRLAAYNDGRPRQQQIEICSGMGFGRLLKVGDEDVYGLEVNFAARLAQDLAQPFEILMTDSAHAALLHSPGVRFEQREVHVPFSVFRAHYELPAH